MLSSTVGKSSPEAPINDNCNLDRAVSITVLSCDGVVAKRYESKTKKKLGWNNPNRQVLKSPTSLVVSFSQNLSAGNSILTHVPSMPMEHLDTSCKAKATPQPLVHWHGMDVGKGGDETVGKELPTLRFTRRFRPKAVKDAVSSTRMLLPETFPLILSLSRCGKLITLGKAEIIITGDEKEDSYIDVPISSTIKKIGMSSPIKKSSSKDHIPMVTVKGDVLQFGLKGDSILRVLVSVTDVQEKDVIKDVQEDAYLQQDTEEVTTDDDDIEVNDVTVEPDENYGSFLEFLSEDSDVHADATREQGSDLSYENDGLANVDDESKVDDPHPTGELPTLQLIEESDVDQDEVQATDACCFWGRLLSSFVAKPVVLVTTTDLERQGNQGNVEGNAN